MNYKKRKLEEMIAELFDIFPIVTITGPRQSGKTTMIKHYINNNRGEEVIYLNDSTLAVPLGILY